MKLQVLEIAIKKQNRGAGIGFVVAGKVLDRTTLKTGTTRRTGRTAHRRGTPAAGIVHRHTIRQVIF